jgi:hypothetical protein
MAEPVREVVPVEDGRSPRPGQLVRWYDESGFNHFARLVELRDDEAVVHYGSGSKTMTRIFDLDQIEVVEERGR